MNRCEGLDRLEFDNELSVDQQVEPCIANFSQLVTNPHLDLPFERDTCELQLDTQRFLVNRLRQAGTKNAVNFDYRPDHPARQAIYRRARFAPALESVLLAAYFALRAFHDGFAAPDEPPISLFWRFGVLAVSPPLA